MTATYRLAGTIYTKNAYGSGTAAASATANVGVNGYITSTSSYHEAGFYINGADRVWSTYL